MITSTANNQIKNVMTLIKKSADRKKNGLFVIEGSRLFSEAPRERIEKVYVSESFISDKDNMELVGGLSYETVSDRVFETMSDTQTPQGILALVRMSGITDKELLEKADKNAFFVVLENLQDPGNLGTIIRTAEGAGAAGVIMSQDTVDIYNPKVIRSTMGSLFRVPFAYTKNLSETMELFKAKGYEIFAAHLDGQKLHYECDFKGPFAMLIGNEGNGLTDNITKSATTLLKIPMEGRLESLNASVSAAVIMYEAVRQRRA